MSELWVVSSKKDQNKLISQYFGSDPDLRIYNQDRTSIKIETIRELTQTLSFPPLKSKKTSHVVCYAELMTEPAQQALLKSLEEPPSYAQVILITHQPQALLPTIVSRCFIKKTEESSNMLAEESGEVAGVWGEIAAATTYSQCIALAERYTDRAAATTLITQLMHYLTTLPEYPSTKLTKTLTILLATQTQLRQNLNVRLTLEHTFFQLLELKR